MPIFLKYEALMRLIDSLTVTNWRGSTPQTCIGCWAARGAAGLARGQRTAVRGRTVCCSHTRSGNGPARPPSACA